MLADIYRQRDSPIVQAILGYIYYIYIANLSYKFWYTINLSPYKTSLEMITFNNKEALKKIQKSRKKNFFYPVIFFHTLSIKMTY